MATQTCEEKLGKRYRYDEDGELEKQCTMCLEYWPADKEFFYSAGHGMLMSPCKACYLENRYPNGRGKHSSRNR